MASQDFYNEQPEDFKMKFSYSTNELLNFANDYNSKVLDSVLMAHIKLLKKYEPEKLKERLELIKSI